MAVSPSSFWSDTCPVPVPVLLVDYLGYCPSISNVTQPAKAFLLENVTAPILSLTTRISFVNMSVPTLSLATKPSLDYRPLWVAWDRCKPLSTEAYIALAILVALVPCLLVFFDNPQSVFSAVRMGSRITTGLALSGILSGSDRKHLYALILVYFGLWLGQIMHGLVFWGWPDRDARRASVLLSLSIAFLGIALHVYLVLTEATQ
ncbi:hypothetical protein DL98DRAFT_539785 [Cadophora sp. DSE1049]|nr:hypothetical protein DL98DRAFT_539785 [Cadophora sp. DSE1049]